MFLGFEGAGVHLSRDQEGEIMATRLGIELLLLQHSLLPGGIILQGVLLLQGSMSVFACHYG
jgi:hypothetical protein